MGFSFKILLRNNPNGNSDYKYIASRIIINRTVKFYFLKIQVKKADWSEIYLKIKNSDPKSTYEPLIINYLYVFSSGPISYCNYILSTKTAFVGGSLDLISSD